MNKRELLNNCRTLIGKNNLSKVFDVLESNFKDTDFISEITQHRSNLNSLKSQERLGVLSFSEVGIARNKIVSGLLGLIESIGQDESPLEENENKPAAGQIINIINSKNVNTGNVNTGGGDFTIGD